MTMCGGSPYTMARPAASCGAHDDGLAWIPVTCESVNDNVAPSRTCTPVTSTPHGIGPATVKPDICTCAPPPTRTMAVRRRPSGRCTAKGVRVDGDRPCGVADERQVLGDHQ